MDATSTLNLKNGYSRREMIPFQNTPFQNTSSLAKGKKISMNNQPFIFFFPMRTSKSNPLLPTSELSRDEKEQVENHLIASARKILKIHYNHYNRIDQKSQWFLTLMGAVEGYFIINFFLNWKFDIADKS
jgi:hypothetical protein